MGKLTILTSADAVIESLISKAYKKALDFYNQQMEVVTDILKININTLCLYDRSLINIAMQHPTLHTPGYNNWVDSKTFQ